MICPAATRSAGSVAGRLGRTVGFPSMVSGTFFCPGVPARQCGGGEGKTSPPPPRGGAGRSQDEDFVFLRPAGEPGEIRENLFRAGDVKLAAGVDEVRLRVHVPADASRAHRVFFFPAGWGSPACMVWK